MAANDKQVAGTHYKSMGVEPWDVVDTWPVEQRIGAYRHGALKYLMRMGSKDEELQEIQKSLHYLEKLVECLQAEQTKRLQEQYQRNRPVVTREESYESEYNCAGI